MRVRDGLGAEALSRSSSRRCSVLRHCPALCCAVGNKHLPGQAGQWEGVILDTGVAVLLETITRMNGASDHLIIGSQMELLLDAVLFRKVSGFQKCPLDGADAGHQNSRQHAKHRAKTGHHCVAVADEEGWLVDATPELASNQKPRAMEIKKNNAGQSQLRASVLRQLSIPYSKTMKSLSVIPVPKAQYMLDSSRLQRQPSLCNAINGPLSISPSGG